MISEENLLEALRKLGSISNEKYLEVKKENIDFKPLQICQELVKRGHLNSSELNHALALIFQMPIILEPEATLGKDFYKKIPYTFIKKHLILPLQEKDSALIVALTDPLNLNALAELRFYHSAKYVPVYSPKETLIRLIDLCYHQEEGAASQLLAHLSDSAESKDDQEFDIEDLLDDREQAPIIKLLNLIITEAIQQRASDIHIEPYENDFIIRYRIDGILHRRHAPPKEYQSSLITRIKVLARMDIAERRLPQDGRIKLKLGGREIDFRVSTLPIIGGERIVLRILDKSNVILGLDQIGMPPPIFEGFCRLINYPEGIILVTGPTGSGKTTTLYSAICEIYSNETNIMTIEDPVEYKIPGIAQMGVQQKIKLDFATGLRHILRQDPDVVLIGEIRDRETAEIAIQAALTGHLVFSTLHTNDAPSAITRLVDMGIEPYLLSSSIIGVLAQRLVRTICPLCKTSYRASEKELSELQLEPSAIPSMKLFRGQGCEGCFGSGYKGRRGIYEMMGITHALKKQIVKSADAVELRQLASENGFTSLKEHGADLVRQGITTTAEVLRVTH